MQTYVFLLRLASELFRLHMRVKRNWSTYDHKTERRNKMVTLCDKSQHRCVHRVSLFTTVLSQLLLNEHVIVQANI